MTIDQRVQREYRRLRRDDKRLNARDAWSIARARFAPIDESALPDGVTYRVDREPDYGGPHGVFQASSVSKYGPVIDRADLDWTPNDREYRYWVPESGQTIEDLTDAYVSYHRMPRDDARRRAVESLRRECEQDAAGYDAVTVTVTDEHGLTGSASICGIDDDFVTAAVVNEYDLIGEALAGLDVERRRIIELAAKLEEQCPTA